MKKFRHKIGLIVWLLLWAAVACEKQDAPEANYENPNIYFSTMRELTVEVHYEIGAEPFVGLASVNEPRHSFFFWSILQANLASIFEGRRGPPPIITVPKYLTQMESIPKQNRVLWTSEDLLHLAQTYRHGRSTPAEANFFIVFVNGYLVTKGKVDKDVVGVRVVNSNIIGIFKSVIRAEALKTKDRMMPTYIEQSALVHEMGHALGLVNNGLPLTSRHQDVINGDHCTNNRCVMFWRNDVATGYRNALTQILSEDSLVLFGDECLADVRSANNPGQYFPFDRLFEHF